ncbi:putative immunity protein, partial [Paenibacillus phocaensis]|uniref:putative immunity protein n=1 Tax=Paenibacillus phocaensis TaxID=1776378 RepID=UPI000A56B8F3
ASAAARAAGHAAATAHVAGHAPHSATYAAKAMAHAAEDANAAKANTELERQWQLSRLLELGSNR